MASILRRKSLQCTKIFVIVTIFWISILVWLNNNNKTPMLYCCERQKCNPDGSSSNSTIKPSANIQIDIPEAAFNTVTVKWPRVVQDQSVICSLFHLPKRPVKEEENEPVLPLDCLKKGDELPWVKLTGKMAAIDVDEEVVCWFRGLELF